MRVDYIRPSAEYTPGGFFEFSKTVEIEKSEKYNINIFTTGRYILKINGKYICEGPCKGHEYVRYYDSVETDAFCEGKNEIRIIVLNFNDNWNFTTIHHSLKPEIIFEAKSETNTIVSDTSWECIRHNRYDFIFTEFRMLPPYEKVDFSIAPQSYSLEKTGGFDFSKGIETSYGIAEGHLLQPRPIPMIFPCEDIEFTVVKKGDNFIELDSGKYTTAKVWFEFSGNVNAKIIYSECYIGKNFKGMRDDTSGKLIGHYDEIKTTEDMQYSPFWFRSFRFIRIEADNIDEAFKSIKAKFWHYPIKQTGSFECSDDKLNKMYEISVNTMLCCTHDTFYDCPYYEQQQYIMDTAIECSVLMRMTDDVRMVRKSIEEFAVSQQPDTGLLLANYPANYSQIIPGFSFFWIFLLNDYLEYSKDITFAKKFVSCVDKILSYFDDSLSEKGLINKSCYWDFADWVVGWPNGEPDIRDNEAITLYNMYYAYALLCAENICKNVGRSGIAEDYAKRYDAVKKAIFENCYDKERGLFTDGEKGSDYSMHTIMWSVLSEILTGKDAQEIMGHINDEGLKKSTFSVNYYLFRAFEKCGKTEEIFNNLDGWEKMIDLHCTTWCENPDNPRSECHAWSSAPLYEFSSNVLGVKVGFDDEIVIRPVISQLTFAKGNTPTRYGDVFVSWKNENSEFRIEINSPEGIRKRVILPNGEEKCFTQAKIEL